MLTLQVIAAGLLLLGSALVIRTVVALDAPAIRPAARRPPTPLAAPPRHRTPLPERRAA